MDVKLSVRSVHFMMLVLNGFSCIRLFATPCTIAPQAPLSMGSPGKNTGVGCSALLQGLFPTQGLNPHLLHLLQRQVGSLPLMPPGKPSPRDRFVLTDRQGWTCTQAYTASTRRARTWPSRGDLKRPTQSPPGEVGELSVPDHKFPDTEDRPAMMPHKM